MAVYQEVTYTLQYDHISRAVNRGIRRDSASGLWTSIGTVIVVLFGFGVSMYMVWQFGSLTARIVSVVICVLIALLLVALAPILFGSGYRTRSREFPARARTLRLTDDGIELVDKGAPLVTRWSTITGIEVDRWGIYFEPSVVAVVPKSAFSTPSMATEFVECARKLHRENAGRAPEVFHSELPALSVSYTVDLDDLRERLQSHDEGKKAVGKIDGYRRTSKIIDIVYIVVIGGFFLWNLAFGFIKYSHNPSVMSFTGALVVLPILVWAIYRFCTGSAEERFQPESLLRGITANLPRQSVRIDERGVTFGFQGAEAQSPWTTFASIDLGPRLIRFQPTTGPATINIPRTAFSTEDDLSYFVDIARAYIDSARTGQPPQFPESPSWPPPPR